MSEWKRRWNQKNNLRKREAVRAIVDGAKSNPCADCGVVYDPYVMDFDHVRGEKLFGIGSSSSRRNASVDKVLEEIAKCDVVCANCHRLRTKGRETGSSNQRVSAEARSSLPIPIA